MKKSLTALLCAALFCAALTGCGSSGEDSLVTKTPFPEFSAADILTGEKYTNDCFADYDATVVNFWNNGCGTCIEEMPELQALRETLLEDNVNLIGVGADSGESAEQHARAQEILNGKEATYPNLSPDPESAFYTDFISEITGYPTTYIVDSEGNIIGAPIIGNVKKQEDTLNARIAIARGEE